MISNLQFAIDMAACAKAVQPNAKVVFGGVAATPLRKRLVSGGSIDFVVRNRGEVALPALLNALNNSENLATVGNLTFRDSRGKVHETEFEYGGLAPNDIPFPEVGIIPASVKNDIRLIRLVHAIGCPYKCHFCTIQTIGRPPSYFGVDRVIAELDAYRSLLGEHTIYFGDETFTLAPDRTIELCGALKSRENIVYDAQTRLDCLSDDRLLAALAESGCVWLEIGIEWISQGVQDSFKQGTDMSEMEDTLCRLKDHGIATCSFLINGLPGLSLGEMHRGIDRACDLIERGLLHATYLFNLVPYAGSSLHDHPERHGLTIRHYDYRYYNEDLQPVYDTRHATAEEIHTVFLRGLRELGQAMSERPSLGYLSPLLDEETYGAFWVGLGRST